MKFSRAKRALRIGLVNGNRIQTMLNGDQIFPAMLGALRDAKTSITFETYIYWSSTIGKEFEMAFADAARRGVQVKVLVDWIGGELTQAGLERMRASGVEVRLYNPSRWNILGRFNNRTHRKLMVVDGRIGFIGGVGIADNWRGHAQDPEHWRGTHFMVEQPVVAQLQSAFIDNWKAAQRRSLSAATFVGRTVCRPCVRKFTGRRLKEHAFEYQPTMFYCKVMDVMGSLSVKADREQFGGGFFLPGGDRATGGESSA